MIEYADKVMARVSPYVPRADNSFRTSSGYTAQEEEASARLRQYWADKNIPIEEKLRGLDFDFTGFDARNISDRELLKVGLALCDAGLLDNTGLSLITSPGVFFNAQGLQINRDVKVDAIAYVKQQLEIITKIVRGGDSVSKDMIPKQKFALTVLEGLQEYKNSFKKNNLIDTFA